MRVFFPYFAVNYCKGELLFPNVVGSEFWVDGRFGGCEVDNRTSGVYCDNEWFYWNDRII